MDLLQLELETSQARAEALSDLLERLGAVSVTLKPGGNESVFDTDSDAEKPRQRTAVVALLHPDSDLDITLACLRGRIGVDNIYRHTIELIKDRDWVGAVQAQHRPVFYADRVCICPGWCALPNTRLPVIILDPGLAFGTGAHPTTSLCIEWLAENPINNKTVVDYGCGSGILAMVAAVLGAGPVFAVDIDRQAVEVAAENIKRNNLDDKITVEHVAEASLPVADILVANILMNPLNDLAENFSTLVGSGGDIVLSGLLNPQAEACAAVYADCFTMDAPVFKSEWARLHGRRI